MRSWLKVVEQVVGAIADEDLQRRAWFSVGPEASSPNEEIAQFSGDAAIEEFLSRNDAGLSELQVASGRHLIHLICQLREKTSREIAGERNREL